ncbi:MAG: putative heme-binding domain-containing protein [Candidatus Omnitrophota bacterium]|jgi:putative heme-binding domain-containing protein
MIRPLIVLAITASSLFAQNSLKDIPDPNPDVQLSSFKVADGFKIELFAADPMIAKPVQMNWDEQGRLWVVSSRIYPHIIPGQAAEDQVIVLEDTDGDGRADTSTVFADKLLVPTAIIPGDGGAYVGNSTELLHMKDTDGDGKADHTRVVLSGFGTEDTHHILHTLRWGMDGDLYMNQSIYIHSHIETPHGPRRLLAGGVWRFRPETMELEVFNRGLINSWGHDFNRWGQSFQTDGAGGDGINYVFPGTVMATAHSAARIVRGLNPGQPKQCGLCVVSGKHFPDAWQDRLITCDFRGNRINSFSLTESGSSYVSRKEEDLVSSSSVAFRPIDVRMGPDGALYIADWYNPIIQHGEVDFRDERRDHIHGRIWRVSAKDRAALKQPQLAGAPISELLDRLLSDAGFEREQARRLLKEQGSVRVKPFLDTWTNARQSEAERLEALWIYQNIRSINEPLLTQLLDAKDHHVRAAAVRVLSRWRKSIPSTPGMLEKAMRDPHAQVRLEAINALREVGGKEAARLVGNSVYEGMDDPYSFSVWLTMRTLERDWLPELTTNLNFFQGPDALMFAIQALNKAESIRPLVESWTTGKLSDSQRGPLLALIGKVGAEKDVNILLDHAVRDSSIRKLALAALEVAAGRGVKPSKQPERLSQFFSETDPAISGAAFRLAGKWNVRSLFDSVSKLAQDAEASTGLRIAALQGLSAFGASSLPVLQSAFVNESNLGYRKALIEAMARVDANAASVRLLDWLPELDEADAIRVASSVSSFLEGKNGAQVFTRQLKGRTIVGPVAGEMIRKVAGSGRKNMTDLINALQVAGKLEPLTRELNTEEMAALVEAVKGVGHAGRGEAIYRRANLLCLNCHAIGGAGGKVGPDLTSIGASAPIDYQIESLLTPQAKIKEGYHVSMITKKDGSIMTGTVIREDEKNLALRDGLGAITEVQKSDVNKQEIVPTSLMPPGLTNSLRKDEFIDLVAFLSQLGKPGAYNVQATAFVRSWEMLVGDGGEIDAVRHKGVHYPASNPAGLRWQKYTSQVDGHLPIYPDLTRFHNFGGVNYFFVRFELEVVETGEVRLAVNDPAGLLIWRDDTAVPASAELQVKLDRGRYRFTLAISERDRKGAPLRISLLDKTSTAVSRLLNE